MKFIWRRVAILLGIAFFAVCLSTPIHELGHAGFAIALGGKVTAIHLGPFRGFCEWEGLSGLSDNLALAGGIILTLLIGFALLVFYKPKTRFLLRFFLFCLLTSMLVSGLYYMLGSSLSYLISGPPPWWLAGDVSMLIERGTPAPAFLVIGGALSLLALFPLRYIERLTFIYMDSINYIAKDVRIKVKKVV